MKIAQRFNAGCDGLKRFRPGGTPESEHHSSEHESTHYVRPIHPSLRDVRYSSREPGSKLPGYFHIYLREIGNT